MGPPEPADAFTEEEKDVSAGLLSLAGAGAVVAGTDDDGVGPPDGVA
jgi:hypothetical protein